MTEELLGFKIIEGRNNRNNRVRKRTTAERHQRWMPVIDLHNHTHLEAKQRLEDLCKHVRANIEENADLAPFKIVCGRSDEMRQIAEWEMEKHEFEISPLPNQNPGEIIILGPKRGTTPTFLELVLDDPSNPAYQKVVNAKFEDDDICWGMIRWMENVHAKRWSKISDFNGTDLKVGHVVQLPPCDYHKVSEDETEDIAYIYEEEIEQKGKNTEELYYIPRRIMLRDSETGVFDYDEIQMHYIATSKNSTFIVLEIKEGVDTWNSDAKQDYVILAASDELLTQERLWVFPWETRRLSP